MHGHGDFHCDQLAEFVTSGYLVIPGDLTLPMIEDLLDALADGAELPGAPEPDGFPEPPDPPEIPFPAYPARRPAHLDRDAATDYLRST